MAKRQTKKPPAAKSASAPRKATSTVYDVHTNANDNGFGYYNVTVLRMPQKRLHNGRLWLRVADVSDARWKKGFSKVARDELRAQITLNVTNALHWNPLPQGERLPWSRIRLVRIDPPPHP